MGFGGIGSGWFGVRSMGLASTGNESRGSRPAELAARGRAAGVGEARLDCWQVDGEARLPQTARGPGGPRGGRLHRRGRAVGVHEGDGGLSDDSKFWDPNPTPAN